jgi:hypothetical protein
MTHKHPSQPAPLIEIETISSSSREETIMTPLNGQHTYSNENDDLGHHAAFGVFSIEKEHRLLKPSSENDTQSPSSSQTTPSLNDVDVVSIHSTTDCSIDLLECSSSSDPDAALLDPEIETTTTETPTSFLIFRLNYLLVTMVIMLSDGLQGTSCH